MKKQNGVFMKNNNNIVDSPSDSETVLSNEQSESKEQNISHDSKKEAPLANTENIDQQMMKKFGEVVKEYVQIDNEIRKIGETVSKLKSMKKAKEDLILSFMEKTNNNSILITGGKLIKNKAETKKKLTQEIIEETLKEKFKDDAVVNKIMTEMDNKRELKTHVNLKRTHHKKKEK